MRFHKLLVLGMTMLMLPILSAKSNFRGGASSYGIHVEAASAYTKLRYDLPSAKVKAAPSKDWKVTNNNAFMTSFLTPVAMTLFETHPKFDMEGTWPEYKMKIGKGQKPKKRLLQNQPLHKSSRHIKQVKKFRKTYKKFKSKLQK